MTEKYSKKEFEELVAQLIRTSDLAQETNLKLQKEVVRLSNELEEKNRLLARKNRLAELGQMAAGIAHEFRNTIGAVKIRASILWNKLQDENQKKIAEKILEAVDRLNSTLESMLTFTNMQSINVKRNNLSNIINEAIEYAQKCALAKNIKIIANFGGMYEIDCDTPMLMRAFLNIIKNAIEASPNNSEVVILTSAQKKCYEIKIKDSGIGISDDIKQKIFEPFFSMKEGGTGLGLAIVYQIIEAHHGEVFAENSSDKGAVFTVKLPKNLKEKLAVKKNIKEGTDDK